MSDTKNRNNKKMSSASSSTIPVCTSCVLPNVPNACCFYSSVCIPTSVKEVKTVEELIETDPYAQILNVMCSAGFLWGPCCGPVNDATGFTFDDLLATLQSNFPDSSWTATDLETFLTLGISRGLFKKWTRDDAGVTLVTYFANQNLLNINPKNWIYQDLCPSFCAKKQCRAPSSLGGSFC